MRTQQITTSPFGSLPVVLFTNKGAGTPTRGAHVCTTAEVAERVAIRLRRMPHIVDVEVVDATVKDEADVPPDTQLRKSPPPKVTFSRFDVTSPADDAMQDVFVDGAICGFIERLMAGGGWYDTSERVGGYDVDVEIAGRTVVRSFDVGRYHNARAAHTATKDFIRDLVRVAYEGTRRGEAFFNAEQGA